MAEELIAVDALVNTESRAFALYPEDLPAVIQLKEPAANASAKLMRSPDGGENFEDYEVEGTIKSVTDGNTNATAIDAIGIYKVVKLTSGDGGVALSTSSLTPGL